MNKGFAEWKKLSDRVLAMKREEIADRLRQYATARLDLLRHKVGIDFEPGLRTDTSSQLEPHFFFSAAEIPSLCKQLQQLFPAETQAIIKRAEQICEHRFSLLGFTNLDYGSAIDWHCDRVHEKRAPRKAFFQIRYLDFDEVGDSKITWELNRHQHLVTLAKAFRLTGNDRFASEIFRQWMHWHVENPYPIGINWASSLEVAFRSFSWLWTYHLLSGSDVLPARFRSELCHSLGISARHIECYLSTYFSPNTHLLGEGAALFFIGTLCPELSGAQRWKTLGWEILLQATEKQVRPDGLHFEQSVYYHVYALDFFLHALVLASLNGIPIPPEYERTCERMLEAVYVLGRSGSVPRFGDDDGGRLFDPHRNRTEHLLDPLATGAVLFNRGDFKSAAGGFREESLWLLGESGISEFEKLSAATPAKNSVAFQETGLYVMSDSARQLVIDSGPQGADTAGHGHADALSIVANTNDRALLIDPGTFEYVGAGSDRNRFRGTKAHNSLVVDGMDQAEPGGPFNWKALPNVRAEGWIMGETFDLFAGSHDGYKRLVDPVVHRRFVFSRKSRFWFVHDQALGRGQHQLELLWHLSPELSPQKDETTFHGPGTGLSIVAPHDQRWEREIRSEDWSPTYGRKESHPVLRFTTTANLPADFGTLLLPWMDVDPGKITLVRTVTSSEDNPAVCYRFKTQDEVHLILFGNGKRWTLAPWTSDAEFFYLSESVDKRERALICCNGTYVEASGKKILSSDSPVLRCEIAGIEGGAKVICSSSDAVIDSETFSAAFLQSSTK
jgi:hypothetical protein